VPPRSSSHTVTGRSAASSASWAWPIVCPSSTRSAVPPSHCQRGSVHDQAGGATNALPARSAMASDRLNRRVAGTAMGPSGVNVSDRPSVAGASVAATGGATVPGVSVDVRSGSENVTTIGAPTHTLSSPGAGERAATVGRVRSTTTVRGSLTTWVPPRRATAVRSWGPSASPAVDQT